MYAIYARQSVSRKDSVSIENQIELCMASLPGDSTPEIYADPGFSGTTVNRPAFRRLLLDIERGVVSSVYVYRFDRISRSLTDFAKLSEKLRRKGVTLVSCTEMIDTSAPMGMMLVRLLVMFAELEQQTIAGRLRDNYRARAARMLPLGGTAPYGYSKDFCPGEEASVVCLIYRLALKGYSFDAIGKSLNSTGIPSPKGSLWTGQQVGRCLKNPVYASFSPGMADYFKRSGVKLLLPEREYTEGMGIHLIRSEGTAYVAPGSHKGIIDGRLWLTVQDLLLARKPSSNLGSGRGSWLQGLILCGRCGSSCYIRTAGKGVYSYIVCSGKRKGMCMGLAALHREAVEQWAESVLEDRIEELRGSFITDRELACLAGDKAAAGVSVPFSRLSHEDKKAAARLLIKNLAVREDRWEIILR